MHIKMKGEKNKVTCEDRPIKRTVYFSTVILILDYEIQMGLD